MMIKTGISFDNSIIGVIKNPECEDCAKKNPPEFVTLDPMQSQNGKVKCPVCGHDNLIPDMESNNATKQN